MPTTGDSSDSGIDRYVARQRQQLARAEAQTQARLSAQFQATRTQVSPHVRTWTDAYARELARERAVTGNPLAQVSEAWAKQHLDGAAGTRLQRFVQTEVSRFGASAQGIVADGQAEAAQQGTTHAQALLREALAPLGPTLAQAQPSMVPSDLVKTVRGDALVGLESHMLSEVGSDRLANVWFQYGDSASQDLYQMLHSAIRSGDNPNAVAPGIRNLLMSAGATPSQEALAMSPAIAQAWAGQMERYLSQARTIARTEMLGAYRSAQIANYRANSDVVRGWYWLAAIGACPVCCDLDGTFFELGDNMDGAHTNCRCSPVPSTNSWADILGPLGIDTSDIPETSFAPEAGSDWFAQQSGDYQRSILGPSAFNAYQAGALSLHDLVGQTADGQYYQRSMKGLGLDAQAWLGKGPNAGIPIRIEVPGGGFTYVTPGPQVIEAPIFNLAGRGEGWAGIDAAMQGLRGDDAASMASLDASEWEQARDAAIARAEAAQPGSGARVASEWEQARSRAIAETEGHALGQTAVSGDALRAEAAAMRERINPEFHTTSEDLEATMRFSFEHQQAMASALAENPAWREFVAATGRSRDFEFAGFTFTPEMQAVGLLEDAWTTDVMDSNATNVALRDAAQEVFGLNIPPRAIDNAVREQADQLMAEHGEALKAFVQTTYDQSQQWFADQGIEEITLYRGASGKEALADLSYTGAAQEARVTGAAFSSYSADPQLAYGFASSMNHQAGDYRQIVAVHVPVAEVFGTPFTSMAKAGESEFLLFGNAHDASVLSWLGDAAPADVNVALNSLAEALPATQTEMVGQAVEDAGAAFSPLSAPGGRGEVATYELSADDRVFAQQLQRQIPDGGITDYQDAIGLGQQLGERINGQLTDLQAAADEARGIRTRVGAGPNSLIPLSRPELTPAEQAWMRGEADALAAHGGVSFWDAPQQLQSAYQAQARAYLAEIRPVGGVAVKLTDDADAMLTERLASAAELMPSDWLAASNDLGELSLIKSTARSSDGWFQESFRGTGTVAIRYVKGSDAADLESTALHEMTHRMEQAIPALSDIQAQFYEARTIGESLVPLTNGIKQQTKLDEWLDQYLGRAPMPLAHPGILQADGTYRYATKSYELLTMGSEMALAPGVSADTFALQADKEYEAFVLGTLLGVQAPVADVADAAAAATGEAVAASIGDTADTAAYAAAKDFGDPLSNIFQQQLSDANIAGLVGASERDTVNVEEIERGVVQINVTTPTHEAAFEFSRDEAGRLIATGDVQTEEGARGFTTGRGLIESMGQMNTMGVDELQVEASREGASNGYETWARLGFTGDIPPSVMTQAQAEFGPEVTRVEQLMQLPGGPKWWRANGATWDASFDFTPGSYSRTIFDPLAQRLGVTMTDSATIATTLPVVAADTLNASAASLSREAVGALYDQATERAADKAGRLAGKALWSDADAAAALNALPSYGRVLRGFEDIGMTGAELQSTYQSVTAGLLASDFERVMLTGQAADGQQAALLEAARLEFGWHLPPPAVDRTYQPAMPALRQFVRTLVTQLNKAAK